MALDTLTVTSQLSVSFSCGDEQTGALFSELSVSGSVQTSYGVSSDLGNTTEGGGDQMYAAIIAIAASGTATTNLRSFTNPLGTASSVLARVKLLSVRLLNEDQDADNGTTCTGIEFTPAASNGWTGLIKAAGDAVILGNGDHLVFATGRDTGVVTSASLRDITWTNNDSSNAAAIEVIIAGAST